MCVRRNRHSLEVYDGAPYLEMITIRTRKLSISVPLSINDYLVKGASDTVL
ncbi:hypothetical protein PENANT_c134G03298 [Penicillium antarcticum]|uniref:Uncharacterized protein n=1 Tax=Penicillium antarcticum TaxID=416450 RepID=A0A1V6PHY2_9EURO|nr:hypothetical protein PENANT_c134G03298 [Penicillium antarcticum]